jgi:hypothetical protein
MQMSNANANQIASSSGISSSLPQAITLEQWAGTPEFGNQPTAQESNAGGNQFVDRRASQAGQPTVERRQFTNSYEGLSPDAQEFANAVDQYKVMHRRRFISYDEILNVVKSLGYSKTNSGK